MTAEPLSLVDALPDGAPPRPPRHLGADGRRLWRRVARVYALDGAHLELLRLAAEALDRGAEAREAIAAGGAYVPGRWGPRPHPALTVERDSALRAARIMRELGLDVADPNDARPPSRWR